MVLAKVSALHFVAPLDLACVAALGFHFIRADPRCVGQQRLDQRSLASTVASNQDNLFPAFNLRGKAIDDLEIAISLRYALKLQRMLTRRTVQTELDEGT